AYELVSDWAPHLPRSIRQALYCGCPIWPREGPMRGVDAVALTATLALAVFAEFAVPARAQAPAVTAFEGARLIVGNGRPSIENGTLVVEGTKITQAGAAGGVYVPAGRPRVGPS